MNIHNFLHRMAMPALSVLIAATFVSPAQAQPSIAYRYNFVKIDYPKAPASFPLSINSKRQIIGVWIDANGVYHGYLYQGGKFTNIEYPGALQIQGGGTFTAGLNDRGDISGTFKDKDGYQHGFIRTLPEDCDDDRDGKCKPIYRQIDVPGAAKTKDVPFELGTGLGTGVAGINNYQDVVGLYATHEAAPYSLGFKLSHGRFTTIDDPASGHTVGTGSRTFSLNDYGDVVGAYSKQTSASPYPINGGFVFDGKEYISVYVKDSEKGYFGTQANGINNRQEVVGVFSDPLGIFHGLYWVRHQSFTLDYPNEPFTECHSINAKGDITGAYLSRPDLYDPKFGFAYRGFVAFLKDND